MVDDPAIRIGSIVTLRSTLIHGEMTHVGKVIKTNIWDGIGGLRVWIPGKIDIDISLERCYNATEAERKEYFKAVLQYEA